MYNDSDEVFDKLKDGDLKLSSVVRSMNKCIHRKDINQYTIFAEGRGKYLIWKLPKGSYNEG
tara:strand:- start:538 stop:723 length:186 start_codon:yes stop_codon:yes gene_type:complete